MIASGITYSESEQQSVLDLMMATLSAPIGGSFADIQTNLRNQQLYDYFKVTNSLDEKNNLSGITNLASSSVDLTNKIALLVNANSLPNEDSSAFEGSKITVFTQKIT